MSVCLYFVYVRVCVCCAVVLGVSECVRFVCVLCVFVCCALEVNGDIQITVSNCKNVYVSLFMCQKLSHGITFIIFAESI